MTEGPQNQPGTLQTTAMALLVVVLLLWILHLGKALLQPLVVAVVLVYFINLLTHWFTSLRIGQLCVPQIVGRILAVAVIIFAAGFMVNLILININELRRALPEYQENLQHQINAICARLEIEDAPSIQQLVAGINLGPFLGNMASAITQIISRTGIILIYVFFILLEQRTLGPKLERLVTDPRKRSDITEILGDVRDRVRTYVGIKTLASVTTGVLSYLVMSAIGINFASFWAVLIFALNYIPTIGSIVATAFPSILALVQFTGTLGPFVATLLSLTTLQVAIGGIIEPRLMGVSLNISPIVILLSLGFWGLLWGLTGMFLCVPIMVIMIIIFSYFPKTRPIAIILSGNGRIEEKRA